MTAMMEQAAASQLLSTLKAHNRPFPDGAQAVGSLEHAIRAAQSRASAAPRCERVRTPESPPPSKSQQLCTVHPLECAMLSVRLRTSTRARPCAAAHWACETRALALIGVLIGRSPRRVFVLARMCHVNKLASRPPRSSSVNGALELLFAKPFGRPSLFG